MQSILIIEWFNCVTSPSFQFLDIYIVLKVILLGHKIKVWYNNM